MKATPNPDAKAAGAAAAMAAAPAGAVIAAVAANQGGAAPKPAAMKIDWSKVQKGPVDFVEARKSPFSVPFVFGGFLNVDAFNAFYTEAATT